jgi:hypothetical protein
MFKIIKSQVTTSVSMIQDPSQMNVKLNGVRQASRRLMVRKRECLKDEINELETNRVIML